MNLLNLNQYWKTYEDGTEILVIQGVQIASIQPYDEKGGFEVYTYDSDFAELFTSLSDYPNMSKAELKNKVGNIFIGWIKNCVWILNSPCPNI